MKRLLLIVLVAAAAWYGWGKYEAHVRAERAAEAAAARTGARPGARPAAAAVNFFTCDGRNTCGQMTSCEEAKYFIKNCPGMNVTVSGEGVSCERQWCK